MTFKSAADEYINVRAGNILLLVQEIKHPVFERKQNDLKIKIDISLREALLGFEKVISHLDGHLVTIDRVDKLTTPGLMIRIKGEGMPVF